MARPAERRITEESVSRQTVARRRRAGAGTADFAERFARQMTDEAFARYFAEREQYERAMSDRAKRVAQVHGEMAQRYEALAKVFGARR
jgi:hypothetical protein